MMELGVDGTFKRRLKLDAIPNVPLLKAGNSISVYVSGYLWIFLFLLRN
jgi:hypothetical protein